MKNRNLLPIIGERVIVHGMSQKAIVESVSWDKEAVDWKIDLDWGPHGKSKVWSRDENRIWFRWIVNN